jgi:hypothetical protein
VIAALKHLGSIANPEFYEKQRMRFSTWDTPRFISCYGEDLEWLHLPRGLTERVTELVASLDSRLELADDRVDPPSIDLTFAGTLRPQQAAAVADLVGHDRGVLVAPPGAGKTVMACAVIAHHRTPTLVVVDRKELVDQWRSRLVEHLGLRPQEIGQIGGGKDKPTGVVDVAMLQSLARRDDATIFERYGLVVVDECHHLPAVSFAACVQRARSRRWLGLTATPYRRDKLEAIIAFHCGPTRHKIKPGTVAGAELVRRELVVHQTSTEVSADVTVVNPHRHLFVGECWVADRRHPESGRSGEPGDAQRRADDPMRIPLRSSRGTRSDTASAGAPTSDRSSTASDPALRGASQIW